MECTKYFRYRELFRTGKGANRALMEAALWWSRSINRFLVRVEIYDKSVGRLISVVGWLGGRCARLDAANFIPCVHIQIYTCTKCVGLLSIARWRSIKTAPLPRFECEMRERELGCLAAASPTAATEAEKSKFIILAAVRFLQPLRAK